MLSNAGRIAQLEHQVILLSNAVEYMLRQQSDGINRIGRPEELIERIKEGTDEILFEPTSANE